MKEITIRKNILNEKSDVLSLFFKDINKYPIYSAEEQIELAKKAKLGDNIARDKLITSNLRFVITCAKKYSGQGVPLVDLIQSGLTGLILSLENYNPDKGYHFISFAVWYIRREILKEIYNTGRTIRYPITFINKITKIKKVYGDFITKNQREPTDDELIELVGITNKQYNSIINDKSYCQSLDTPVLENGEVKLEDTISDNSSNKIDTFTKDYISKILKYLNDREYKVITEFYGLDGKEEKSIKEIANELYLGEERVRQLRKSAIKKLKSRFGKTLETLL